MPVEPLEILVVLNDQLAILAFPDVNLDHPVSALDGSLEGGGAVLRKLLTDNAPAVGDQTHGIPRERQCG
jgi:hypothetical protein